MGEPSNSFDVVTMGSATQDVFAKSDADTVTFVHNGEREKLLAYPLGTKILIEELEFQVGGGGTNTACTFARQGLSTGFIGKLGRDGPADAVLAFLKKEGIAFLGVQGGQTGYSVILDSREEDRTILTFKGANNELALVDIAPLVESLQTRWLYCSSMLGTSYETMQAVMRHVRARGGKVAFNPSSYQAKQGLGTLQRTFEQVDVLILNREEAELLVGHQTKDLNDLLHVLAVSGPGIVVITDGANGAHCFDHERIYHVVPTPGLRIVETTGAGDAFGSGLVAGLARQLPLKQALLLGMHNAESVISHYGAKANILTREKAQRMLTQDRGAVTEE